MAEVRSVEGVSSRRNCWAYAKPALHMEASSKARTNTGFVGRGTTFSRQPAGQG
jgi:hypothetical protein